MIEPTVGRIVWYRPNGKAGQLENPLRSQPYAAIVTQVRGARSVDLTVFGALPVGVVGCRLLQDGDLVPASGEDYCEWMPYQKGQAAKTEQLEKKLGAA